MASILRDARPASACRRASLKIGEAVSALERAGIEYDSLAWTQPSLENVYLELAGERARVDPAIAGEIR